MLQANPLAGKDGSNVRIMSYNILADLLVSHCMLEDPPRTLVRGMQPCQSAQEHSQHLLQPSGRSERWIPSHALCHALCEQQRHHLPSQILPPLADHCNSSSLQAHQHADELYRACPQWCLNWKQRGPGILAEILYWAPDIGCLQEVDHPDQFQAFSGAAWVRGLSMHDPAALQQPAELRIYNVYDMPRGTRWKSDKIASGYSAGQHTYCFHRYGLVQQ